MTTKTWLLYYNKIILLISKVKKPLVFLFIQ